ncbi:MULTISPECIES: hypothetical protein [Roseateles]|uniref:Uncharacterized protein n=1 Tax=Pelomonas aquatica TaxID=431058 RepID=A0ABU1ZF53_9BURK|nr:MULTISPECIES: hypothetical protein [Roseateles]MDR7299259.1 hypothetical protein [Pelomonas aquatica]
MNQQLRLRFASTNALEETLDGSEEAFARYFFAVYHCKPDESPDLNTRREELRRLHPELAIEVGKRFVLSGEAAFQAVGSYLNALAFAETLSEDYRAYFKQRLEEVAALHRKAQALHEPIHLTEGQLSHDARLEFMACIALSNGQIIADFTSTN